MLLSALKEETDRDRLPHRVAHRFAGKLKARQPRFAASDCGHEDKVAKGATFILALPL
jgi:hypothetical protein